MKINTAKRRMLDGGPAIGAEVALGPPLSAELLSQVGFDFVLVDHQHGRWDDENTMYAFRSIALGGSIPMARVRHNEFSAIGRLLDIGALGIVVPLVNSVEDAEAAAFACRYPPRGGRSGGEFATGFHGPDYRSWIDDEIFLAIQIETVQAAERAEEIMSVDGIDGLWIGPHDLSMSMGVDLGTDAGRKEHEAAIQAVVDACKRANKVPGISCPNAAITQHWTDRGCLFVTTGADSEWAVEGGQEALRKLGR